VVVQVLQAGPVPGFAPAAVGDDLGLDHVRRHAQRDSPVGRPAAVRTAGLWVLTIIAARIARPYQPLACPAANPCQPLRYHRNTALQTRSPATGGQETCPSPPVVTQRERNSGNPHLRIGAQRAWSWREGEGAQNGRLWLPGRRGCRSRHPHPAWNPAGRVSRRHCAGGHL